MINIFIRLKILALTLLFYASKIIVQARRPTCYVKRYHALNDEQVSKKKGAQTQAPFPTYILLNLQLLLSNMVLNYNQLTTPVSTL
ncbi:hypothetical protein D3C87_429350 [compost metagenome]